MLARDGYRAIESLAVGEAVATRFGGLTPIKAISSFTLCREAGLWVGPSRPVRIKRGALGENMPAVDLCLTASHAVFVDGFLVPAGDLVNGGSIVFETAEGQDTLDFFHIALERHDIIDAGGALCESLRDPAVEPCVPLLGFNGGRSELRSRLRSALSLVVDRRQPIDLIRDELEDRALALAKAA
ncbi:MAG: Hint domain-containing protein [Enhydrobacter sp.]|nr:Hint domain-containing protein [Enhydrobacter sp.]